MEEREGNRDRTQGSGVGSGRGAPWLVLAVGTLPLGAGFKGGRTAGVGGAKEVMFVAAEGSGEEGMSG